MLIEATSTYTQTQVDFAGWADRTIRKGVILLISNSSVANHLRRLLESLTAGTISVAEGYNHGVWLKIASIHARAKEWRRGSASKTYKRTSSENDLGEEVHSRRL